MWGRFYVKIPFQTFCESTKNYKEAEDDHVECNTEWDQKLSI